MRRFLLSFAVAASLLTVFTSGLLHSPTSLRADGCTTQSAGTCPH